MSKTNLTPNPAQRKQFRCQFYTGTRFCGRAFEATYETSICPQCSSVYDAYLKSHSLGRWRFLGEIPPVDRPSLLKKIQI